MKWFETGLERFIQDRKEKEGLAVWAVVVLQYPFYLVHADVREWEGGLEKALDYQIMRTIQICGRATESALSAVLGIARRVTRWRLKQLRELGYVESSGEYTTLTDSGSQAAAHPEEGVQTVTLRNFRVDGITHRPLPAKYYDVDAGARSHYFTSHNDMDRDDKVVFATDFNPDIVHTPPSDRICEGIEQVPPEHRHEFNIPPGFIRIERYNPILQTHPMAVVLMEASDGSVVKRLYDFCDWDAVEIPRQEVPAELHSRIDNLIVSVRTVESEQKGKGLSRFCHSWADRFQGREHTIFEFGKQELLAAWRRNKGEEEGSNHEIPVEVTPCRVRWLIDEGTIRGTSEEVRKEIVSGLLRGFGWTYQHETSGVWRIMGNYECVDEFTRSLIALADRIQNEDESTEHVGIQLASEDPSARPRELLWLLGEHEARAAYDMRLFVRTWEEYDDVPGRE